MAVCLQEEVQTRTALPPRARRQGQPRAGSISFYFT